MKRLLMILLLLSPPAMAQEEGVDPSTECAAVLALPPFVDILTRNEGKDFGEISSRKSGRALLGLACSVDELTEFFENAGWEFLGFEVRSLGGPLGGHGGIPEYYRDAVAFYCLKRPTLFGMFGFRCRPSARISFHEGRISNLGAYTSK